MKIERLDAHDRLLHFKRPEQSDYISLGCNECIKNRPPEFDNHPFYIFAHVRTDDDGVTKRLIWAPRLTKPKAQTNSMLFKCYPPGDAIRIIWILPVRELWPNFLKGNLTESSIVVESIGNFQANRDRMEAAEHDDLPEEKVEMLYRQISLNAKHHKMMDRNYYFPEITHYKAKCEKFSLPLIEQRIEELESSKQCS